MTLQNNIQAYILANEYNLSPSRHGLSTDEAIDELGKYEPDHDEAAETRCMVLAHWLDKTNVIVQYNPILNLKIPYHVAGTLTPNATGNYTCESEYQDKPTCVLEGRTFFLWWDGTDSWIISDSIGWKENEYWSRTDPTIDGDYAPQGGATGTATVVAGPE